MKGLGIRAQALRKIIGLIEYDTDKAAFLKSYFTVEMEGGMGDYWTSYYFNELYCTINGRFFIIRTPRSLFKYKRKNAVIMPISEKNLLEHLELHAQDVLRELFPENIVEA